MSFDSLGLSDALLRAVSDQGYTVPTPIQRQAIPAVLAGGDLLAGAQTGTGKTAGFVLPMLQRLSANKMTPRTRMPRALILTPTRELAAQVEASVRTYGKHSRLTSMALFGGVGIAPQAAQLKRGVDILVATPGRLLDHHQQRNVDFARVEIFVLDEADRMLDMGFIPDIKRVLALLPKVRQNLLFSATFSDEIRVLADRLLNSPRTIEVAPRNATVDAIAQRVHPVNREHKSRLLAWLIGHHDWRQVLVFARTKHGADKLARSLEQDGIRAVALHGNKSQGARTKALADFKRGAVRVMVATDIAARGIDIDQLPHVVNYDLPHVPEDYVHRIGRTGRAGAVGEAVSLVCADEQVLLRGIERLIKREIPREPVPGFPSDAVASAAPAARPRGGRPGGGDGRGHVTQSRGTGGFHGANARSDGSAHARNGAPAHGGRARGDARAAHGSQPPGTRPAPAGYGATKPADRHDGGQARSSERSGGAHARSGTRQGSAEPRSRGPAREFRR
jgi:ATP-dependent RNA helicase RhlE